MFIIIGEHEIVKFTPEPLLSSSFLLLFGYNFDANHFESQAKIPCQKWGSAKILSPPPRKKTQKKLFKKKTSFSFSKHHGKIIDFTGVDSTPQKIYYICKNIQ